MRPRTIDGRSDSLPQRRGSRKSPAVLLALAAAAAPLRASAAEKDWKAAVGSGNWSTAGNWVQGIIPLNTDDAYIINNDAISRVITYDYSGPDITLNSLFLDNTGTGTNTLLQAANVLSVGIGESVGYNGRGIYNQSGGVNNAIYVDIGVSAGAVGAYNQTGGSLNTASLYIGDSGNGTFTQSGNASTTVNGTNAGNGLYVGYSTASIGNYTLGGNATLTVAATEYVGHNGTGVFNQTGGSNTTTFLILGTTLSGSGTYTLSGGTLSVTNGYSEVGNSGKGTFNQNGGTLTINSGGLFLGFYAGASGTYTLSNGTLALTNNAYEYVGNSGNGTFNQSGGINNAGINVDVGVSGGGVGAYNQTGGSLTTVSLYVGDIGNGTFNQSGAASTTVNGTNSGNGLYVGYGTASIGTYTLGGSATLTVAATEYVGHNGTGVFNQTSGTNTTATLIVGNTLSGNGTYTLSGGTLSVTNGSSNVGASGKGTFNQSGGTHTINGEGLYLGVNAGGSGTYNLSNGTLALNSGSSEYVGSSGHGTFNQTGGTHTINSGNLNLGFSGGGNGAYTLSNGTLALTNGANEYVGFQGNGTFNQSGGNHTITGTLSLAFYLAGANGTYNLQGGSLTADTVQVNPFGTFNQTGGTLSYATFNLDGGIVTGTLQNQGTFNYFSGTFAGRMLNQGVMNLPANFTFPNGLENDSVLSLPGDQTITLGGAGLDNEGTLTLAGGTLVLSSTAVNVNRGNFSLYAGGPLQLGTAALLNGGAFNLNGSLLNGSGAVTNGAGGVVIGPGTISAPFLNSLGVLAVQGGTLNVVQPFNNAGVIQIGGATASLAGGVITNTGSVQGAGSIGNTLQNGGTVEALGGTLYLTGAVSNTPSGLLRISGGNKLLITAGLATNFGTINLQGGIFDNNNKPLSNSGVIAGYGTLSTGGLTNNPGNVITFTGGLAVVNGSVTNSAGATIRANYYPVLFTGPVVNNGTIKINGAPSNSVTFAASYSGSGQYLSDPADNFFQDVTVTPGGLISGGVGDRFFINGAYVNSGTYSNNGGTLSARNVINSGQFNQTAGQATLLNLSGTGSTTVGGAGTSLVTVTSFAQGSISIQSGGNLQVTGSTPHSVTNTVTTLSIANNNALLDIDRQDLLIDNTATPFSTIHNNNNGVGKAGSGIWDRGYNYNPANGFGQWDGTSGLTSATARASHQVDARISVGYIDGGVQNDPNIGDLGIGLPTNRILVRPSLNGDLNLDGKVDGNDIGIIIGLGYFGTGSAPHGWLDGDINGDGVVDGNDIGIIIGAGTFNNGSYGPSVKMAKSTPTLTGSHSGVAQTFNPNNVNDSAFNFETKNPTVLDLEQTTASIPDHYDLGNVLPPGLSGQLLDDLTLQFNVKGGGLGLKTSDLLGVRAPEPTMLGGIAVMGLLAARRRPRRRKQDPAGAWPR